MWSRLEAQRFIEFFAPVPYCAIRLRSSTGTSSNTGVHAFRRHSAYVATDDLKVAVNAAITLERPLLVKGEPGTGKTVLALEIAKSLGAPLLEWHVKSTTKALQGLYEYDAVSRLRDSQLGDERVKDIRNYIKRGKLWDAFVADARPVLLIDEIDKADIEFPNDLLQELDRMEFFVYETARPSRRGGGRSWSSPPTTRRNCRTRSCAAASSTIRFPDGDTMRAIIECISRASSSAWCRALSCSTRSARYRGEEEALDFGAARLAQAPDGRGHRRSCCGSAIRRSSSALARRAVEERAGRPLIRASGLHGQTRRAVNQRSRQIVRSVRARPGCPSGCGSSNCSSA